MSIIALTVIVLLFIFFCGLKSIIDSSSDDYTKKNYPPRIEYSTAKGVAYVSVYEENNGRYGGPSGYKRYTFILNGKGKWRYKSEKIILYILLYLAPVLIMTISYINYWGSGFIFDHIVSCIGISLMWGVAVYGIYELEGYQAEKELNKFFLNNPHLKEKKMVKDEKNAKNKKNAKNNKNVKDKKEQITDNTQKNEDKKYDLMANRINLVLRILVFLFWLVILCAILILYMLFGMHLYGLLIEKDILFWEVFLGISLFVPGPILYGWICMRRPLMGDYSYIVPIVIAGKEKKYEPKYVLKRLNRMRSNVILLKNKEGQVRIYGCGNEHVLEIQTGEEEDARYFHLTQVDTDSIVPVSDKTPTSIENKWCETFPVRSQWLVDEETIISFLRKLYSCKDIQAAMDGFSFEDSTEETNKLIKADDYIVPKIPVDRPIGGRESKMGQAWLRRKEARVQHALDILSKS